MDLKYAKAELGEIQHRLQEKTQENLRKKDIISHLESRQRDGAVDSTTQARIKHLEDHIMQLEQHRAVRRMSESTNPVCVCVCVCMCVCMCNLCNYWCCVTIRLYNGS